MSYHLRFFGPTTISGAMLVKSSLFFFRLAVDFCSANGVFGGDGAGIAGYFCFSTSLKDVNWKLSLLGDFDFARFSPSLRKVRKAHAGKYNAGESGSLPFRGR